MFAQFKSYDDQKDQLMVEDKEVYKQFMQEKEDLLEIKRDLDQSLKLLDEQAVRIVAREEKILADAQHKIDVIVAIQEKLGKQSKCYWLTFGRVHRQGAARDEGRATQAYARCFHN